MPKTIRTHEHGHFLFAHVAVLAYRLSSVFFSPIIYLYLKNRVRCGRDDPARYKERFGSSSITTVNSHSRVIWFHAASVGETLSIRGLLQAWKQRHPNDILLLTTMTRTAAAIAQTQYGSLVIHQYAPFDVLPWVVRFVKFWNPARAFVIDSEIWPTMVHVLKKSKIPLVLLNGRISDRSYRRWSRFRGLSSFLLGHFDCCYAQNTESADRLRLLGANDVRHVGNLKFSVTPLLVDEKLATLLNRYVGDSLVFMAASTHPKEEIFIWDAYKQVLAQHPSLVLCVASRHPERAQSLVIEASAHGIDACLLGQLEISDGQNQSRVVVVDRIGVLGTFYEKAHVVFIGGSLVSHGGQNPIEPAMFKKPILYGKNMFNFRDICKTLTKAGAITVNDAASLAREVSVLLSSADQRKTIGDALFSAVMAENKVIESILDDCSY